MVLVPAYPSDVVPGIGLVAEVTLFDPRMVLPRHHLRRHHLHDKPPAWENLLGPAEGALRARQHQVDEEQDI